MRDDLRHAIGEAARLAERLYAPVAVPGGLGAALRASAVSAGVPASVDVAAGSSYPPEIVQTIHRCWLDALDHPGASIVVREEGEALTFEVLSGAAGFDELRGRVESLGGALTVEQVADGTRVSASLPLVR